MIVTRFAPSPTGYLHLGHAFAAMTAFDTAVKAGGRFLLRIENIDLTRSKREFEIAIEEDLSWLGISWEKPILRQSERFAAYSAALETLKADDLLYPCFCTRSEVALEIARAAGAPHGPEGPSYPGTCRSLPAEERHRRIAEGLPYALRLDCRRAQARVGVLNFHEHGSGPVGETGRIAVDAAIFGDVIIARKEIPASYHVAVVVDDAWQGVTLVTRGNDLFSATHIQRVLQKLLGLPHPDYAHHTLILDGQGRKLSKRDSPSTLRSFRDSGQTPEDVRSMVLRS